MTDTPNPTPARIAEIAQRAAWMVNYQDHCLSFSERDLLAHISALEAKCRLAQVWQPIESAPRDGTFILIAGPSGYSTTPLRVEVARYYPSYRPNNPWQTHSNDDFTDGGELPSHWMPLPPAP